MKKTAKSLAAKASKEAHSVRTLAALGYGATVIANKVWVLGLEVAPAVGALSPLAMLGLVVSSLIVGKSYRDSKDVE
jgi:hypothetical protein